MDECGYLTHPSIPQSVDEQGNSIWWCKCGKFRTKNVQALKEHIEGEETPIFLPLAFLVVTSLCVLYYSDYSIASVLYYIAFLFVMSFITNQMISRWFNKKEEEEQEVKVPVYKTVKYIEDHTKFIEEHAEEYDPLDNESLRRFERIKKKSECYFARKAKVWGCADWNDSLSIEENVIRSLKMLQKGLNMGREIKLDGFLFEVRGEKYGNTLEAFGETVRRVLTAISDHDPACEHCMESEYIDRRGWRFTYDSIGIFVTCFAPCYPVNHSRYAFGEKESSFILLQPQYSFSIHDIGPDHPWDDSKTTIRQKIRQNFKNAGRLYYVPKARFYPMAPMIVPPYGVDDPLLTWYKKPPSEQRDPHTHPGLPHLKVDN